MWSMWNAPSDRDYYGDVGEPEPEVVQFPWDRPVEVCLKYDGLPKSFTMASGAERYRFTLNDGPPGGGRVMFFDESEARRIAQFPAGECFWIRKRRGKGKGAKAVWDIWAGEQSGSLAGRGEIPFNELWQDYQENWVEITEFVGVKKRAGMQLGLPFEEVA